MTEEEPITSAPRRGWFARQPVPVRLMLGWSVFAAVVAVVVWLPFEVSAWARLVGLVGYLVVGNLLTPTVDLEDLGWGRGALRVDNPFSVSDDWNRLMLQVAFFFAPAKLVLYTLRLTWAALTVAPARRR